MRNSLITQIRRSGLRRLKSIALFSFTALHLYTFTPVVNAQWGATVPNPIMEYHYTYDNNGNITKIEDKVNGTEYDQSFTYDEVDRVSSAIGPYGSQSYTYDAVGNTLDITPPVTNTYDNGNIIDYNGKHIDYDYENRPVKITNSNNNTVTEFAYDYSGQRVYTKISSGTITSEDYYVGNIYEEKYSVDSSNPISASTSTVTYVYAGSIRVAGLTTQTTATGTENNTLYYHGDHLGSSSIITDGSGTVVRNISYQPWGNVQSNTEESGASTPDPNHKFTGQILDESTDLYYYGARYYDPQLRRFITPDTIVQSPYDPQSLNRYAYVRNNPLIYVDPSGHWRLDNFLVSTLQVASYASMFAGGWGMPIAIASSMAQTGLQGGHLDDAIQAGAIGGVSSLIGQGVALGIGPAGIGEGFGRTMAAGAGAGFASGGIGAIMSGQSGSAVWQSAFQGAAMGAATSGVMWGITQGNSDIANYRELVEGYRQAKATKSLDISQYPMYAMLGDARTQIIMDGGHVPAKTWSNFYYPRINKLGLIWGLTEMGGGVSNMVAGLAMVAGSKGMAANVGVTMFGAGSTMFSIGIVDFVASFSGQGPSLLYIGPGGLVVYYDFQTGEQIPPKDIFK